MKRLDVSILLLIPHKITLMKTESVRQSSEINIKRRKNLISSSLFHENQTYLKRDEDIKSMCRQSRYSSVFFFYFGFAHTLDDISINQYTYERIRFNFQLYMSNPENVSSTDAIADLVGKIINYLDKNTSYSNYIIILAKT